MELQKQNKINPFERTRMEGVRLRVDAKVHKQNSNRMP